MRNKHQKKTKDLHQSYQKQKKTSLHLARGNLLLAQLQQQTNESNSLLQLKNVAINSYSVGKIE